MALDATQLDPVTLLGPDGSDRPDPTTLPMGYAYKPRGIARLDIVERDGSGTRVWGSIPGVSPVSILTDPTFYVDPVSGSDSNAGTIGAPFATINHTLQAFSVGYFGLATINLRAGTHTIGNRTVFPSPLGNSNTSAGGLLINGIDNTDSGLGVRTSNGGTTGTLPTFGTVIDSVGGLTVNAWRGSFIRFTSGATLNGRSFLIVSNTATTFTVCGTLPVAPTTETFVVESPGATISWSGTQSMQGSCPVGVQNIAFTGGGGSNAFRFSGFVLGQQRCTFASMGSGGIQPRNGAGLTDLFAIQGYLGTTSITQQCGSYFNVTPLSLVFSSTGGLGPSQVNLNRCLFNGSNTEAFTAISVQYLSCYFVGNSYTRFGYGVEALISGCRFDTVTPAPVFTAVITSASGAAVVFSRRSSGLVSITDISNTPATTAPGDAIFIEDSSTADVTTVTGSGNAGLGCRVNRLSQVRKNLATTVTGTLGDVKIGANAVNTWGGLGSLETDPVELCIGGPNV